MESQSAKVTTQNYPLTIKSGRKFLHSSGPAFLFGGNGGNNDRHNNLLHSMPVLEADVRMVGMNKIQLLGEALRIKKNIGRWENFKTLREMDRWYLSFARATDELREYRHELLDLVKLTDKEIKAKIYREPKGGDN